MKSDKLDNKVKRIGPHIEIYQLFQGRNKLVFTKRIVKLITITQAFIRGWLERKRFQRIKTKVRHASQASIFALSYIDSIIEF